MTLLHQYSASVALPMALYKYVYDYEYGSNTVNRKLFRLSTTASKALL